MDSLRAKVVMRKHNFQVVHTPKFGDSEKNFFDGPCGPYEADLQLVLPGDVVCMDAATIRGHGTYEDGEEVVSSVAGVIRQVNRLKHVKPLFSKYFGEIGDVVVGRVSEVASKKWKIDANAKVEAVLPLASVMVPGAENRRKTLEDELTMREYMSEGDVVVAEVHSVLSDGALQLQARSEKYGKLGLGLMVKVTPSLVSRTKTHFHRLPCGVTVILANNGYVWVSPLSGANAEEEGVAVLNEIPEVTDEDRLTLARVRNCIEVLASDYESLTDTSIVMAYEASEKYAVKDMLRPTEKKFILEEARERIAQLEADAF